MKPKAMRPPAPRPPAPPRRRAPPPLDATTEPGPGPLPEAVFDRVTGPYAAPRGQGGAP